MPHGCYMVVMSGQGFPRSIRGMETEEKKSLVISDAFFPRSRRVCRTKVENGKKHRQNIHLIIHFPMSEGVSEVSERANE